MDTPADSHEDYLDFIPEDRRAIVGQMIDAINNNLPAGFEPMMSHGHPMWVVPHSTYPPGYHCDPKSPLPFLGLASQKNFIALYHMGVYADPILLAWFQDAWKQASHRKLDMGKSCIRFKKPDHVPISLIGELASKMSPAEWIQIYESNMKR